MQLSKFWIMASDDFQSVTMRADDEEWEWDAETMQSIVMPLVTGAVRQVWANGLIYELTI